MIAVAVLLFAGAANTAGSLGEVRRLYTENRLGEAETILTRILKAEPRNADARLWLAYTRLANGDLESALQIFEQLGNRFNSDPEYLFAVSEASTRRARELSEKISALGDSSARAHQLLAYRYNARGEWQITVRELHRAAELRPSLPGLHLDAAEILWQEKQYTEAAKDIAAELTISPSDFLANLRYGEWLLRSHQTHDAIPPLETAARYFRYPEAHALLAFAWREIGDADRALAVLNSGLKAFPGDRDLSQARDQLLQSSPKVKDPAAVSRTTPLKESSTHRASLRAKLARNPGDEDAIFLLSRLYAEGGDASFRALEQIAPDSYRVWQIRGLQAESAGDLAAAENCYRKVVAMHDEIRYTSSTATRPADARTTSRTTLRRCWRHHVRSRSCTRHQPARAAVACRDGPCLCRFPHLAFTR
jgi:tetratricopeptide (TPR) repeat protein